MTVTEQKQFIRGLIDSVRDDILAKVFDMPSTWDGIELRQYIADRFMREALPMKGARLRNFYATLARITSL